MWDAHKTDEKLLGSHLSPQNTLSHQLVLSLLIADKCTKMYKFERHISHIF